jgi:hypothetical protein
LIFFIVSKRYQIVSKGNRNHNQNHILIVLCVQVELGELDEATYRRIMGIQRQDLREPELPEGMGVEPE